MQISKLSARCLDIRWSCSIYERFMCVSTLLRGRERLGRHAVSVSRLPHDSGDSAGLAQGYRACPPWPQRNGDRTMVARRRRGLSRPSECRPSREWARRNWLHQDPRASRRVQLGLRSLRPCTRLQLRRRIPVFPVGTQDDHGRPRVLWARAGSPTTMRRVSWAPLPWPPVGDSSSNGP